VRSSFFPAWKRIAALGLSCHTLAHAQVQSPPSSSYDPQTDVIRLDWQSPGNRTFFPQASTDLDLWSYIGALHFGAGPHVGMVQTDAPKAFFRLQYSDLPVANEAEAETADFDLDGLQNIVELQEEHTDPLDKDTDKDGLPDGWEVAHSISPLDDGSIDPANGPYGEFGASPSPAPGTYSPLSITTNANAYGAGVQGHSHATMTDRDGDGIADDLDAGPLSRAIDWESGGSPPQFIYHALPGYDLFLHGSVLGCNNRGDVLATKAAYINGSWVPLAKITPGTGIVIDFMVDGRMHKASVRFSPLPSSISDDGRIVGTGRVRIEPATGKDQWGTPYIYEVEDTYLAYIWDTPTTTPRLLAHPFGSLLWGQAWDESAQIAEDGTIVVKRRANPEGPPSTFCRFVRYDAISGGETIIGDYPSPRTAVLGEQGFLAFNANSWNAYAWLPDDTSPRSLLADSSFSGPNSRSTYAPGAEPTFIGHKPGAPGGYCLNFWDKAMIRHEGRWQEAVELGDTTLITRKGVAFKAGNPNAVQVWNGGEWESLASNVVNHDFSSSSVIPLDSTADGRVLISSQAGSLPVYGYLIPTEFVSRDKFMAGSFEIPPGWDNLQMEFVGPGGENLGKYGDLLGGGATKIYDRVTDILNAADFNSGGQSSSQKVWFVRDPANNRRIDYYTCFNSVGQARIDFYLGNSHVAAVPHTLVGAQDFAETIAYVDAWVKGTSFNWGGGGDPSLSLNSFGGGIDNLTRACLIPFFNVVDQVEGLGSVVFGLCDGVKAGAEDDWNFIQLIGQGAVLAKTWASQQAQAELQEWKNDPLKRAVELKMMADRICEDVVFSTVERMRQVPVTWESFKKLAWSACAVGMLHAERVFILNRDVWGQIVDGLTEWADDFVGRMAQGAEKAHWENVPWAKYRLVQDANSTDRLVCYTFGYTFGYLCEQVAVGALTSGVGKIAQVAVKGGVSLAANLARRTGGVLAARAYLLKRMLSTADVSTELAEAYGRGFAAASTGPVSPGMPYVAMEAMQEGVVAGRMLWREHIDDIFRVNIRKLVRQGQEAYLEKRFTQLMTILGPDFDATIGRNFLKVVDELILVPKADGTVEECFEAFFRAFQGNPSLMTSVDDPIVSVALLSSEGKATLKKFLSGPDPGKLWDIDVPAIVDGEPAVPHNYWVRGILGELSIYRKQYKALGYSHSPTAKGFDFTGPKWVQIKTLKNPDGAIGAMKKAIDDLIAFSPGPPNPKPLKLHILKKPGTSSSQLESALRDHIESSPAADRLELVIQEFDL